MDVMDQNSEIWQVNMKTKKHSPNKLEKRETLTYTSKYELHQQMTT